MRWLRSLFSALLVFGLSVFACPKVAKADLLDLSYSMRLAFHNYSFTQMREQSTASAHLFQAVGSASSFSPDARYTLVMGIESYTNVHETGTGTFTESGSTSTNYNSNTTGTTSDSGYYNSTGHDYGSYDNPNSVLGDDLGYGADTYVNGTVVTNGTVSTSEHGSGTGTYTGTGSNTSTVTGQNQTIGHYFWDCSPGPEIDMTGWGTSKSVSIGFVNFGTYPSGTVLRFTGIMGNCTYMTSSGAHGNCNIGNYAVWLRDGNNWQLITPNNNGNFVANQQFSQVYVVMQVSNMPEKMVSFRVPYSVHMYIDLDATYNSEQMSNDNTNTNAINSTITSTTQQQTNALKDTTGADSIVGSAQSAGNNIVNRLGFVTQTANFVSSSFNAISNASASSTVRFPRVAFQNYTIIEQQDVPLLGYLPSEVETTLRTFGTLLFTLVWINGLKRMYDKIFGGEKVVEVEDE